MLQLASRSRKLPRQWRPLALPRLILLLHRAWLVRSHCMGRLSLPYKPRRYSCRYRRSLVVTRYPPQWANEPDLLLASPDEPGGTTGNGFVGAWVPRGLPGSAGPPLAGVEHVKGIFAPRGKIGSGPDNVVSLAPLGSWTATAFVAAIGETKFPGTASAMDVRVCLHACVPACMHGNTCAYAHSVHAAKRAGVLACMPMSTGDCSFGTQRTVWPRGLRTAA